VEPDKQADQDAEDGNRHGQGDFVLRAEPVVDGRGGVDADKCDKRAEVQQLGAPLIAEQERSKQGNASDQENIVARHMVDGIDRPEEA